MPRLFDVITITTVDAIVALIAVFLLGWGALQEDQTPEPQVRPRIARIFCSNIF
jgi:hypothetical protein